MIRCSRQCRNGGLLTRASIVFAKWLLAKRMDGRVKPGHDGGEIVPQFFPM
jgi:hypothetical protein